MGITRDIDKLKPELARRTRNFLKEAEKAGMTVAIIETLRTNEVQLAYYAQGRKTLEEVNKLRTAAGLWKITDKENKKIITHTLNSRHLGGNAVDICPVKNGKIWWTAPPNVWEKMGKLAEENGLDWCAGGYGQVWGKGWDNPHFELME